MKINFKVVTCHWCGSTGAFLCECGYPSCIECKLYPVDDKCVHKKKEEVVSDGWILEDDYVGV